MKTIYEEILQMCSQNIHRPDDVFNYKELYDVLLSATLINITNVVDYYFNIQENDLVNSYNDYPNTAPCFPITFFEYTMPITSAFNLNEQAKLKWSRDVAGMRIGILSHVSEIKDKQNNFEYWTMRVLYWFSLGRRGVEYMPLLSEYRIEKDGKLTNPDGDPTKIKNYIYPNFELAPKNIKLSAVNTTQSWLNPVFLSLSFMHCKNVTIESNDPKRLPNGRISRHSPKITYKTLKIEPMKKILETEGDIQHNGLKRALHICRGHFKDFTQGPGLFGRNKGLYWWDSQVRGKIENGIVVKDYSVNAPDEGK